VISRRELLVGAAAAALVGCSRGGAGEPGVVRLGIMANLTHAPALVGVHSGRFERALGGARLETRIFRAGPRVVEALLGDAIDVGTTGPAPVVTMYARHPDAFRVILGVASGGASLVFAKQWGITAPNDLRGKTLATPQIGCTQDVALKKWLAANGLSLARGDVNVTALASPDIRAQVIRGGLAGAWVPEPWGTRLVTEGAATRFLDERTLWPDGRFPTALALARTGFMRTRALEVERLRAALADEVRRAKDDPAAYEEEAYVAMKALAGNPGPRELLHAAWPMVDFTIDPLPEGVAAFAQDAHALGLVPEVACARLFTSATA
jgi:NitT/TauT family transport system substrate-binding protein